MSAAVSPSGPVHRGPVAVPGGQLHTVVQGERDAPVLVFLHALGTDLRLWEPQAQAFSRNHRVIRYDIMGHGLSPLPARAAITLDDLVDELLHLLGALAVPQATLVGSSMGAVIALAAAAREPRRFEGLTLCGARLQRAQAASEDLRGRSMEAAQDGLARIAEQMLGRWFPSTPRDAPRVAAVARMLAQSSPSAYATCAAALASYDLRPALAAYAGPVLLLSGELDEDVPRHFELLAQGRSRIRAHSLARAGHFPHLDQPARFNALLAQHLGVPAPAVSPPAGR